MSRIGKKSLLIPNNVSVQVDSQEVIVKGDLGELRQAFTNDVVISVEDNVLYVKPVNNSKASRQAWGLYRRLVEEMVLGVSAGYKKKVEINGVGYKAALKGKALNVNLGFSHEFALRIPDGVKVNCVSPTVMEFLGANKQQVTQFIANIYHLRKPEPYKGKGVIPEKTYVLRKEGKKK